MKKAIRIINIILIIILIKFVFSFVVNEMYISKYRKEIYKEGLVKSLKLLNFSERYIAHYNYGNYYYQTEDYEKAINEYNKALELRPPKGKECSIRINKALCILKSVDLKNKTAKDNIEILYKAREVLCEEGCANTDNSNGHSKEAEKLKAEIDNLIEEIKEKQDNPEEQDDPEDKKKENEKDKDEKENQKKEEELKKREKESKQEREQELKELQRLDGDGSFSGYGEKNW